MQKKKIMPFMTLILCIFTLLCNGRGEAAMPDQQAQLRAERLQLEANKKKMLFHCEQFKTSSPESYTRCVKEYTTRHEMDVQLLMRDPDAYFAKKTEGSKNSK